jgi:hypothetical protein
LQEKYFKEHRLEEEMGYHREKIHFRNYFIILLCPVIEAYFEIECGYQIFDQFCIYCGDITSTHITVKPH